MYLSNPDFHMGALRAVAVLVSLLVVAPLLLGALPARLLYGRERYRGIGRMWCSGFLLMLALFQPPAVLCVTKLLGLHILVWVYLGIVAVVSLAGLVCLGWDGLQSRRARGASGRGASVEDVASRTAGAVRVLWCVFAVLFLAQMLIQAFVMTTDGDDAYYIGHALSAVATDRMYMVNVYTGAYAYYLDYRHILAPLPMWLAVLSYCSGVHVAILAHVILPLALLPATYLYSALLGERLFPEKSTKRPLFLILLLLIVSFSNYSVYTRETFLLTRTWQGKAVLAGLVLTAAFYYLYLIAERTQRDAAEEGGAAAAFLLLAVTNLVGMLASTMGAAVLVLMELTYIILIAVRNHQPRVLWQGALSLLPCVYYGGLYMLHQGALTALQNFYQLRG